MLMGDVRRNRWIVIYIPVCLVIMVGIEGLDGGTVLQNDKLKIRSCNGIKFPSGQDNFAGSALFGVSRLS